jgi:hypothetical protein
MLRFSPLSDLRDDRVDLVLRALRFLEFATKESSLCGCFGFADESVREYTRAGLVALVFMIDRLIQRTAWEEFTQRFMLQEAGQRRGIAEWYYGTRTQNDTMDGRWQDWVCASRRGTTSRADC